MKPRKIFFLRERKENLGVARIAVYSGLTTGRPDSASVGLATV